MTDTSVPVRQDQFAELLALEPGWLDGAGKSIAPATVETAQAILQRLAPDVEPGIFPTEDGGVQLEWMQVPAGWFTSAEVCPDGAIDLFRLRTRGESWHESEMTSEVEQAATWLRARLTSQV